MYITESLKIYSYYDFTPQTYVNNGLIIIDFVQPVLYIIDNSQNRLTEKLRCYFYVFMYRVGIFCNHTFREFEECNSIVCFSDCLTCVVDKLSPEI